MFLSGYFAGTIDFGLGAFETTGVGDHDAFIAEIDRMGQTRPAGRPS